MAAFSDAEDPLYVYAWRLEQEASLRCAKGDGMTDEQVTEFVNGCKSSYFSTIKAKLMWSDYPSYELYTDRLRAGVFDDKAGRQLRLVIGKDRSIREILRI